MVLLYKPVENIRVLPYKYEDTSMLAPLVKICKVYFTYLTILIYQRQVFKLTILFSCQMLCLLLDYCIMVAKDYLFPKRMYYWSYIEQWHPLLKFVIQYCTVLSPCGNIARNSETILWTVLISSNLKISFKPVMIKSLLYRVFLTVSFTNN